MASPILPALSTLPPELLLQIITHLRFDDRTRLRVTSAFFDDLIPSSNLQELLAVETEGWAVNKSLLACSGCVRLRRSSEFSCNMFPHGKRRSVELFPKDQRLCFECGAPGIQRPVRMRCRGCDKIVGRVDGIMGMCEKCYEEECKEEVYEDKRGWVS